MSTGVLKFLGDWIALKWIKVVGEVFNTDKGNHKLQANQQYGVCYKYIFGMLNLHTVQL